MTTMIHHLPEPTTSLPYRATGNPDDIRTHPVSVDGRKRARACLIMNHSFTTEADTGGKDESKTTSGCSAISACLTSEEAVVEEEGSTGHNSLRGRSEQKQRVRRWPSSGWRRATRTQAEAKSSASNHGKQATD